MNAEALIWVLFIIFLVLSNITSYKMGHSRGLLRGITTFELIEVRRKLAEALSAEMWEGNSEADVKFDGLHMEDT